MRLLVLGLGVSGYWACRLALRMGFSSVTAVDESPGEQAVRRAQELSQLGVDVVLGCLPDRLDFDLLVVSPGVRPSHPLIEEAWRKGIEVVDETEFAFRFVPLEVAKRGIVITGTNGKTTTVSMLGHVLGKRGSVFVGGNYGVPLSRYVLDGPCDFLVLELSSFQIGRLSRFVAMGGAILNVAQDHVDYHGGFERYLEAKLSLLDRLLEFALVNGDDPVLIERAAGCQSFSASSLYGKVKDERMLFNLPNVACVVEVARRLGVDSCETLQALRDFSYPPFRMERVGEVAGRVFYNDSKATNPHAVERALRFLERPVVLIMGGVNKGMDFSALRDVAAKKVRHLVAYGEAGREIAKGLSSVVPCEVVGPFEEAVRLAWRLSHPGDAVLLSPGCASFDQFSSYVERGKVFNRLVEELSCGGW